MVPHFFEVIPENLEHMQLVLYPFYIGGVTLLQQWPAEESRLKVLARPFDKWVGLQSTTKLRTYLLAPDLCHSIQISETQSSAFT